MLGKIALLSVFRRPRRAALIMAVVALSVFVMEFLSGWVQGSKERMNLKILRESPHVLVERAERVDALDPLAPVHFVADSEELSRRLAAIPNVTKVERVLRFGALCIAGDKNLPLAVYGTESHTSFFSQVAAGRIRGNFPFAGSGLAVSTRALQLLGSPDARSLTILVEDVDGAPAYRELPVACVFKTDDSEFDASTAFVDFGTASDLLGTQDASELWLRLSDANAADAEAAAIRPLLNGGNLVARAWPELQGSLLTMIKLFGGFMIIINLFVLVVAATVITNAILMNVFEKQKEYGTLRAIGLKRRQQAFLVLAEGAAQGIAGSLLGAAAAFPLVLFLQDHGLALGAASRMFGGADVIYFGLSLPSTLEDLLCGILIAVIGSLYAALVGTRAPVVDALKGA